MLGSNISRSMFKFPKILDESPKVSYWIGPNMKSSFLSNFAQDACFGGVGKI